MLGGLVSSDENETAALVAYYVDFSTCTQGGLPKVVLVALLSPYIQTAEGSKTGEHLLSCGDLSLATGFATCLRVFLPHAVYTYIKQPRSHR